jgi:hypothetical protein
MHLGASGIEMVNGPILELALSLSFSESMDSQELLRWLERRMTVLKDLLQSIDAKHRILGRVDREVKRVSPISDAIEGDLTLCTQIDMKGMEIGEIGCFVERH